VHFALLKPDSQSSAEPPWWCVEESPTKALRTTSAMPDAGKKRSHDEDDEPTKKSRGDGDSKDSAVHVYQPCVVLPELAGKMNSLVEVCLAALILSGSACLAPPPSERSTPAGRRCSFPQSI